MIVVTGASGFLGRAVVAEVLRRGLPVLAVSRQRMTTESSVPTLRLETYSDLTPPGGAVLVHLAEPRALDEGSGAKAAAMRETFRSLAEKAWDHIVYVSSASVYGDAVTTPRRADEPIKPQGAYAEGKAVCERVAIAAGGTVARLANLYGPGMAPNNVVSDILNQLGRPGPLALRDAKSVRDYLWIADAATGVADAAVARPKGPINLGTGIGTSVGALARRVLALAGQDGRAITETAPQPHQSTLVLDISQTFARLGWAPATPLARGLAALLGVKT